MLFTLLCASSSALAWREARPRHRFGAVVRMTCEDGVARACFQGAAARAGGLPDAALAADCCAARGSRLGEGDWAIEPVAADSRELEGPELAAAIRRVHGLVVDGATEWVVDRPGAGEGLCLTGSAVVPCCDEEGCAECGAFDTCRDPADRPGVVVVPVGC